MNHQIPVFRPRATNACFTRTFYISFAKITLFSPPRLAMPESCRYNIHIYQSFSSSTFAVDLASDLYCQSAAPTHSGVRSSKVARSVTADQLSKSAGFLKVFRDAINFKHAQSVRGSTVLNSKRAPKLGGSHI